MPGWFLKRVVPAVGGVGLAGWAAVTTVNDDWDEVWCPEATTTNEKIVVVGSGWGAMQTVRKLGGKQRDLVVVSPRPHFVYTPLLAGSTVGTVSLRSVIEPFRDIVDSATRRLHSATYVRAAVRDVDFGQRTVQAALDDGSSVVNIKYDKLVIAVGAEPATFGIKGVKEHAYFMKEASDADAVRQKILENLEKASALLLLGGNDDDDDAAVAKLLKFVVVGGGPTGVELAGELADFCKQDVERRYGHDLASRCKIVLVEAMPRILASFDSTLADFATESLESLGVEVLCSTAVSSVKSKTTAMVKKALDFRRATKEELAAAERNATRIEYGALVWAAGITTRPITKHLGEKLGQVDVRRGLKVDDRLRVVTSNEAAIGRVFALGDCADSGFAPTAQVASQQGRYLGRSLRDESSEQFSYSHQGSMAFIGNHAAIAQLSAPPVSKTASFLLWRGIHGANTAIAGKGETEDRALTGFPAFVMWRSIYFSQLVSSSNRFGLLVDWLKVETLGRDVVTPSREVKLARRATNDNAEEKKK